MHPDTSFDPDPASDRAYAMRESLHDALAQASHSLSVAALTTRFLAGNLLLSGDELLEVMARPALRDSWAYLIDKYTLAPLPVLSAAATGDIRERPFPGGTVQCVLSTRPGQAYVKLKWGLDLPTPKRLLLQGHDGQTVAHVLPDPPVSNTLLLLLDLTEPADDVFLRLLLDPRTSGRFLAG